MRVVAISALLLAMCATAHAQQPVGPTGSAACPYGLKAGPDTMECAAPGHPYKDGYYPPQAPPPHKPAVWNEICGSSGAIRYGCRAPPSAPPPLTRGGGTDSYSDLKEIQKRAYQNCVENPQTYPHGHCGAPP
jgi:hypothetical protein